MYNILYDDLMYGNYRNRKFTDIFDCVDTFLEEYKSNGLPQKITDESARILYYLLYARYGNSTIASSDETQFKYKLFALVFEFGPTWEKELAIQDKVRALTDEEIEKGSTHISNVASNPDSLPSTATLDELTYVSQQSVNKTKRGKLEGYSFVLNLLKKDVTEYFLGKFKKLFLVCVEPELPLWYETEEKEDLN